MSDKSVISLKGRVISESIEQSICEGDYRNKITKIGFIDMTILSKVKATLDIRGPSMLKVGDFVDISISRSYVQSQDNVKQAEASDVRTVVSPKTPPEMTG
jgi:hypothetical protein